VKSNSLALAIFLVTTIAAASTAAPSRFTLASQDDWGANRGFYLNFENETSAGGKSTLSSLKLVAGVADGKNWQYLFATPAWTMDHLYSVDLKVAGGKSTLTIDGVPAGDATGGFEPQPGAVTGDNIPEWANAPTEYSVNQTVLSIRDARGESKAIMPHPLGAAGLFGGGTVATLSTWHYAGGPFTVHVEFRLAPVTVDTTYNPLVDKYGQPTFIDYAGKVKADADLTSAIAHERKHAAGWAASIPFDKYGGASHPTWHDKATGFYHLAEHNGFSWLIDPVGAPLYYTGVCTVSIPSGEQTPIAGRESMFAWLPKEGTEFAAALGENPWGSDPGIKYASFVNANLIRKYGAEWRDAGTAAEKRRVREWGFSGFGKWSANWDDVPSIPVLYSGGVPSLVRHPDFFDLAVVAKIKDVLTSQITPHLNSPVVVGWSYGNEYDEVFTTDEIKQILQKPADTPSRKALVDYAVREIYAGDASKTGQVSTLSDTDIEKLRQFYADKYYGVIHDTIKAIDPNHLFLGWWLVPFWWQNENDWKLQAAHVDVLGIDHYARTFDDPKVLDWVKHSAKPILIGEYSFPPDYDRARGFGTYQSSVSTPEEAGKLYGKWMDATASNPNVIGVCWFEMRDEGIAGRGPGQGPNPVYGEHFAFGLVDVTDTPKWPLVDQVRAANLRADQVREKASTGR